MLFLSHWMGRGTGSSLVVAQARNQHNRWLWGVAIALVAGSGGAGCGGSAPPSPKTLPSSTPATAQQSPTAKLAKGDYPVQQVRYSETTGDYTLTLLNRPAGQSPLYTLREVMLAQLSRPDQQAGKGSFLRVEAQRSVLYLKPDFKIDYVPNVSQGNPATSQAVAWRPWAGDRPMDYYQPYYYQPPFYSSSGMYGYGGYGSSYQSSIDHYQQRNNRLPPAQKSANFRSTGNLRSPAVTTSPNASPQPSAKTSPRTSPVTTQSPSTLSPSVGSSSKPTASPSQAASPSRRATGAGYGSSTLRTGSSSSGSARSSSSSSGRSSFGSSSRSSSSSSRSSSSSGRRR